MTYADLWPLGRDSISLFVAGKTIGAWEEELGEGFNVKYPWELLDLNVRLLAWLAEKGEAGAGDRDGHATVHGDGVLMVGEGTRILPGVYVEGMVLIGKNCKIGPNCYLRGSTTIGDNCHIGQAVEVKNSIVGHGSAVGHLSYLGDSVVGEKVNFGAGTITSNFRHDGGSHRSLVKGELIDTGRLKFGAIVGDGVHTGIHTAIYPGRKLGPGTSTRPGEVVQSDLF